eukprot:CAMPEP_0119329538 /NCGR_PEP_ID=MMETSP1333-20130426/76123_1 /TAXON_ID=418940 /ORGANISM="Scyphosphaera apsteinii, Strain RCC1455" /LENGTH=34 /DNA_ID= /DNA_START= /DNA_END= /DNA_ORIENTATION=
MATFTPITPCRIIGVNGGATLVGVEFLSPMPAVV